jgi:Domain of unknown function (DUF397)
MYPELSRAQWRKSSYSGNSGNCVEVAQLGSIVAVRDSNDHARGSGPDLRARHLVGVCETMPAGYQGSLRR